jgi:hypothetical protein
MFTNPFVQSQQMLETWTQLTQEQVARMTELSAEAQRMQGDAFARTREAIDETARLMKETLDYAAQLSNEWRRITLEAAKRTTPNATPAAKA